MRGDDENARRFRDDEPRMQRKLQLVGQLYDFAYAMKRHQLRLRHPEWSDAELHRRTVELIEAGCR